MAPFNLYPPAITSGGLAMALGAAGPLGGVVKVWSELGVEPPLLCATSRKW